MIRKAASVYAISNGTEVDIARGLTPSLANAIKNEVILAIWIKMELTI